MKVTTMKKIRIVADSSADVTSLEGVEFASAPLKIITSRAEYVDNAGLDAEKMAEELFTYKGRSSTSCPNTADWLAAFGDADCIFCVTITATLSGSYNSAMVAKREYEEAHPDRKVFVFNSLSTGPEMLLIMEEARRLILEGLEFDEICRRVEEYSKDTGLIFILESLKNLANNGRVSPVVAKMAGILGIRLVAMASEQGDIKPLHKCRGARKALEITAEELKALGYSGGKLRIGHCLGIEAAEELKAHMLLEFPKADIRIYKLGGLCSFYAERGGVLIGFERK